MNLLFKQAESAPVLKTIVKMGKVVTTEEREMSNETGIAIYTFQEVEVGLKPSLHLLDCLLLFVVAGHGS